MPVNVDQARPPVWARIGATRSSMVLRGVERDLALPPDVPIGHEGAALATTPMRVAGT
jgi:hypothetical protein